MDCAKYYLKLNRVILIGADALLSYEISASRRMKKYRSPSEQSTAANVRKNSS
jgi:hypothetical protein